jgi:anaerobic magnesium-protoporphyrin IX monomethyl ester cyclase
MAGSILLSSTYFAALDPKQLVKRRPYPPLGTLYAAAALRARGHDVSVFDAMLAPDERGFDATLAARRPAIVVFYEDSFNFLSKMCLSRMREAVLRMAGSAAAQGALVIVAGADMTDHPGRYLRAGARYVLAGEADLTLVELIDAIAPERADTGRPHDIAHVDGVAFADARAEDGIGRTRPRAPERYPDRFPFPARDLIDIESYRRIWHDARGYFSLNMVSTRGCPFHCNWCAKPIWGQRYAMRSAANVVDELAAVKATIAPDHVWFADDIFGLRPEWVAEFAAGVQALDARVPFTMQSRADLMTDRAVGALATAGCQEVWLGVESGSQRVLDAMDKGIAVDDVIQASRRLKAAGIRAAFFVQFGYPGETLEDVWRTVDLVRALEPDDLGISVSYPLPGTPFHQRVHAQLGSKTHWTDSGDLAMMFEGTYDTAFYRRLHALLHREVDLRRSSGGNGHAPADAEAREALHRAWAELARGAADHRSRSPTALAPHATRPSPPDLTRSWN